MILESIVTTINADDSTNISPMGPVVDEAMRSFLLRPFQTSTTFRNLKRIHEGVLHITDDVLLFAKTAVGKVSPVPELLEAEAVRGRILADACRWYAFRTVAIDDSQERTEIHCEVVETGQMRPFFGFNRAKHAVLEAAILATRLHILPAQQVRDEFARLASPVEKTAGPREEEAFRFLQDYVEAKLEQTR